MISKPTDIRIIPEEYGFPLKLKPRYDNFIGGRCVRRLQTIRNWA